MQSLNVRKQFDLADLMQTVTDETKYQIFTTDHAEVISYNPDDQTAMIQPSGKVRPMAKQIGVGVYERQDLQPLPPVKCRVEWPSLSVPGVKIIIGHYNLPPKSQGIITFLRNDDSEWRGGTYDPEYDYDVHGLTGATFRPCVQPDGSTLTGLSPNKVYSIRVETAIGTSEFTIDLATGSIDISSPLDLNLNAVGTVNIGQNAAQSLISLETLMTIFNAHTHLSAAPGSPTGPPTPVLTSANAVPLTKVR